jgi:predicted RNA-binding Zn ribbon-like protein
VAPRSHAAESDRRAAAVSDDAGGRALLDEPAEERAIARAPAARRPEGAAEVLAAAIELREALAALLTAGAASEALVARLNAWLARAPERSRVAASAQGYAWVTGRAGDALLAPLWPVVWSAADLLVSGRVTQVRACTDRRCAWLFLDASRGRRRRWCSMEGCGNRAKARRHYRRRRAA